MIRQPPVLVSFRPQHRYSFRGNILFILHLKRLLAVWKSSKAHTRAGTYRLWATCPTRFSSACTRADGALAPGRRWLAACLSNLADLLPGLKQPGSRLRKAHRPSRAGGGRVGCRGLAIGAGEHLGRWRRAWWAIFRQFNQLVAPGRALDNTRSRLKALATRLRQIDRRGAYNSWRAQLKNLPGYFAGWSRRYYKSWVAAIRRIPGLAGLIPNLSRFSGWLRDSVESLGRRGWTSAVSTWWAVVARLSEYAMRRGLAMARNAGPKRLPSIYLGKGKEYLVVDPECPFGYTSQIWSAKAMDAYLIYRGATDWQEGIQLDGECPIGYVRQILVDLSPEQVKPPPPPELADPSPLPAPVEPSPEWVEPAEFHAESFLLILHDAYLKVVENRADGIQDFAPVVPLVDVYAWVISSQQPIVAYSKQEFTRDVYRLHASGVDTTEDGARVSFPISRGVRGKTLTTTNETGGEVRYYGIRFLQRSPVAQT